MKYLEFVVNDNLQITRAPGDKTLLISGAVNYFGIHFTFGEEFSEAPGMKAVEFYKNRQSRRLDLVDGACAIPNELLTDNKPFEMRVVSGASIGTQWASVSITESGMIFPEEIPDEPISDSTEYVKTLTGGYSVGLFRVAENGLEYSQDGGLTWSSGVNGVPEVPQKPKGAVYGRSNGDWVRIDKTLEEIQEALNSFGGTTPITEVQVDGTALTAIDGSVNIDLTPYAKSSDVAENYATKEEVESLPVLQGSASTLTPLDYSETDTATIVQKVNEIINVLLFRGIATE